MGSSPRRRAHRRAAVVAYLQMAPAAEVIDACRRCEDGSAEEDGGAESSSPSPFGAGIGAGIIKALGNVGLPATSKQMVFLFSGPRLFPTVELNHLVFASIIILLVSITSTLYPALIATKVEPVVAMQAGE